MKHLLVIASLCAWTAAFVVQLVDGSAHALTIVLLAIGLPGIIANAFGLPRTPPPAVRRKRGGPPPPD